MLLFKNYVAPSSIEGVGVFTAEKIKKDAIIWRPNSLFDVLIPAEDIECLPDHVREFVLRYGYLSNFDKSFLVIEADNGRFMNHSIEPNTDFTFPKIGTAVRDIDLGEEVTCNYGDFCERFELLSPVR